MEAEPMTDVQVAAERVRRVLDGDNPNRVYWPDTRKPEDDPTPYYNADLRALLAAVPPPVPDTDGELAWKGTDRNGFGRTGRGTLGDVRAFVESRFNARWLSLRVWAVGNEDDAVAEITRDEDGRRTWWADSTASSSPAAPPAPDSAPMPDDVRDNARHSAKGTWWPQDVDAAALVGWRAGLAARRPAGTGDDALAVLRERHSHDVAGPDGPEGVPYCRTCDVPMIECAEIPLIDAVAPPGSVPVPLDLLRALRSSVERCVALADPDYPSTEREARRALAALRESVPQLQDGEE